MSELFKYLLLVSFLTLSPSVRSQTCYVAKTGTKYHMPTCSYLKYSSIAYDLTKAMEAGYTACSRCNPTKASLQTAAKTSNVVPVKVVQSTTAVQCTGKTQAGARCKRMTKNASGYCYQHG
jgi:methylphosphotriester-DNA--protein-cysteine methyltransferase